MEVFEGMQLEAKTAAFATGLKTALESKTKLNAKEKKALKLVNDGGTTKRRAKRLAKMEAHAAVEFGENGAIDWENFDFNKFLDKLVEFLMQIWNVLKLLL